MRWDEEKFAKIKTLVLNDDERNQLIGLELIQQGEYSEDFAPLLTFLMFGDERRTVIVETAKQILAKMKSETQIYWEEVSGVINKADDKNWNLQKFEKYIILFDNYVKIAPRFSHVYRKLGKTLLNTFSTYSKGLEYLRKAADCNPEDYDANYEYAAHLEQSIKNADTIIKHYTRCWNLRRNSYNLYHNLGKIYALKKDYQNAIEVFQAGWTSFPSETDGIIEVSLIFKEKGDISVARTLLEDALRITPKSHLAHYNLASLLWESCQEYKLALKHIKQALKIKQNCGLYWHTMAKIYWCGLKKKKEALAALYKGRENDPDYKGGHAMIKELGGVLNEPGILIRYV